jgi:tight adherence protein C
MPPIIIIVTLLGGVALFLFSIALLPQSSVIDKRLADLDRSTVGREVSDNFFSKMIDEQQASKLARKLMAAGWYTTTPAQILMRTVAGGAAGIAGGISLVTFVGDMSWMWLGLGAGIIFVGFAAATVLLNRAVEARQKAVQRALPDLLDMLTTTVEAGVSLNGALVSAVEAISGPLSEELKATMSEVRLGRSRAEALMAMAERVQQPDLLTTIIAIVQAERLGGNIVSVLEEISVEARESRMMRIEELAAQLPVKMVFPMALFMLPALIVMIFGPVVANMLTPK